MSNNQTTSSKVAFLEKVAFQLTSNINLFSSTINQIGEQDIGRSRDIQKLLLIGNTYVTKKELEKIIGLLKNIEAVVKAQLRGEYPIWIESAEEIGYCPYLQIEQIAKDDWDLLVHLNSYIRDAMRKFVSIEDLFAEGLKKFFNVEVTHLKTNAEGEAEEMNEEEITAHSIEKTLKNIEIAAIETEWTEDMVSVMQIIDNRAKIEKVLNFL